MEQSVLGGLISQAQGDSGLAGAIRSFNPILGDQSPTSFPSEKEVTVFEETPKQGQPPEPQAQQDLEMMRLMMQASKTKFATGNPEVDVKNYLTIKNIGKQIMGLIE